MSAKQAVARPRPDARGAGKTYWRAGKGGHIELPQCTSCGLVHWYPRVHCPHCGADTIAWIKASGRGTVHTYTIVRQSHDEFFKTKVPYVLAMIDLPEGVRIMSNVIGCDVSEVRIGTPVHAVFEDVSEDVSIPLFKLGEGA